MTLRTTESFGEFVCSFSGLTLAHTCEHSPSRHLLWVYHFFRMAYSDFVQHYSNVEICNLTPEALSCDVAGQWAPQQFEGSWKGGSTAGGYCKGAFT